MNLLFLQNSLELKGIFISSMLILNMFEYKLVAVYQLLITEVMIKFCDENDAN